MRPKSSNAKSRSKAPAEAVVKDIRRATRRHFSAEDKIRIVLEGLRGDLDGRCNLTQAGLTEFTAFFLSCCLDQVTFMEELLKPEELLNRIEIWCNEEVQMQRLPKGSWSLLREAVLSGEFSRSQVQALTGYQERQARTVLSSLLNCGVLASATAKGKVRLGFPVYIVERWLPRLYPAVR